MRTIFAWVYFLLGYAWAEDKEHCEEYGRMLQADPSKVSARAKKRGLPQVRSNREREREIHALKTDTLYLCIVTLFSYRRMIFRC